MSEKAQFNLNSYNYQLTQDLEQHAKILHKRDVNIFCRGLYTDYQYATPSPSPPRPVLSTSPQNWPTNNYSRNLFPEDTVRSSVSPHFPTAPHFNPAFRPTYAATYPPFPMMSRAPCFPRYRATSEYSSGALASSTTDVKFEPSGQE